MLAALAEKEQVNRSRLEVLASLKSLLSSDPPISDEAGQKAEVARLVCELQTRRRSAVQKGGGLLTDPVQIAQSLST